MDPTDKPESVPKKMDPTETPEGVPKDMDPTETLEGAPESRPGSSIENSSDDSPVNSSDNSGEHSSETVYSMETGTTPESPEYMELLTSTDSPEYMPLQSSSESSENLEMSPSPEGPEKPAVAENPADPGNPAAELPSEGVKEFVIKDLDDLIYKYTGRSKEIVNKTISPLTTPGENYSSFVLKVDVTLRIIANSEEEVLHIVAKCIRETNSDYFNYLAPLKFKREIEFYTEVIPALEQMQLEQGRTETFKIFPKLLAARRNLHGRNKEIDKHAVILLENLEEQGYSNIDRHEGFDLEATQHIIQDIAVLHALPLGLKMHNAQVFLKFQSGYELIIYELIKAPNSRFTSPPLFLKVVQNACKRYKKTLMQMLFDMNFKGTFYNIPSLGPYCTIVHQDLWVNNTMQKIENGRILQNKFIDFQSLQYGSPVVDIVMFLFTSVQQQVVKDHLEDLVLLYEKRFFEVLAELNCRNISRYSFLRDLPDYAPKKLIHILYLIIPIFCPRDKSALDYNADPSNLMKEDAITPKATEHIVFVLKEFERRGWLKIPESSTS